MTWRLLYVRSGREYAVLAELVARKMDGYVPTRTIWKGRPNRRVPHKTPMLPSGYVFADLADEDFAIARGLPDVSGSLRVIGAGAEETMRNDRIIGAQLAKWVEQTRAQERAGQFDETKRSTGGLSVGERVKITVGAWMTLLATITGHKGKNKVYILVDGFEKPTPIDVAKLEAVA